MDIDRSNPNVERMATMKDAEGLIRALEDEDLVVRAEAAVALGMIKDERAVDPLIQALKDESASVRDYASEALALISAKGRPIEMLPEFNFDNYSRHVGSREEYERFEWKVFMDESPEKVDKVRSVEYRLHKTFPSPIRIVEDPKSRFALRSAGWGEFWIFITIYLKDGTEKHTKYYLDLGKPWPAADQ